MTIWYQHPRVVVALFDQGVLERRPDIVAEGMMPEPNNMGCYTNIIS
jgi:hypothetical protein